MYVCKYIYIFLLLKLFSIFINIIKIRKNIYTFIFARIIFYTHTQFSSIIYYITKHEMKNVRLNYAFKLYTTRF